MLPLLADRGSTNQGAENSGGGDMNHRTPTSTIKPTTPGRAMRAYCLDCTGGDRAEVRNCTFTGCPLYPYRMGKRPPKGTAATPMKTIRANCLECCSGSFIEVRRCPAGACPVHRYRSGRKVAATGELSSVKAFSGIGQGVSTPAHPEREKVPLFEGV